MRRYLILPLVAFVTTRLINTGLSDARMRKDDIVYWLLGSMRVKYVINPHGAFNPVRAH